MTYRVIDRREEKRLAESAQARPKLKDYCPLVLLLIGWVAFFLVVQISLTVLKYRARQHFEQATEVLETKIKELDASRQKWESFFWIDTNSFVLPSSTTNLPGIKKSNAISLPFPRPRVQWFEREIGLPIFEI